MEETGDSVLRPSHYNEGRYETLDKIDDFISGKNIPTEIVAPIANVLKYLDRLGRKAPDQNKGQTIEEKIVEDLGKSLFYLKFAYLRAQGKTAPEALSEIRESGL